ncbi:hypothetical protein IWQ62_003814 [Dispira parvispora]|uniref:Uncharacterized protein n=1 Tax=Dispira parvispora TaxID=1520584 RepID=A0A9W8AMT5_9FUNG|nr:hypothetical protein IWQ62_003814 [Dispira parvispora]
MAGSTPLFLGSSTTFPKLTIEQQRLLESLPQFVLPPLPGQIHPFYGAAHNGAIHLPEFGLPGKTTLPTPPSSVGGVPSHSVPPGARSRTSSLTSASTSRAGSEVSLREILVADSSSTTRRLSRLTPTVHRDQRFAPTITKLCQAAETGDLDTIQACLTLPAHLTGKTQTEGSLAFGNSQFVPLSADSTTPTLHVDSAIPSTGMTALHHAAKRGQLGVVQWLVDHAKGTVDFPDRENETALLKAAYHGQLSIVKFLLQRGANVQHTDKDGWTALHNASSKGHLKMVRWLCEKASARVDVQNIQGYTPLMNAAAVGQTLVVKYLLYHMRANPLIRNGADENAYDVAAATVPSMGTSYLCDLLATAERQFLPSSETAPSGRGSAALDIALAYSMSTPPDELMVTHHTVAIIILENQRLPMTSAVGSFFRRSFGTPKFSPETLATSDPHMPPWCLADGTPCTMDRVHLPPRNSQPTAVHPLAVTTKEDAAARVDSNWYWLTDWFLDLRHPQVHPEDGWQYARAFSLPDTHWITEPKANLLPPGSGSLPPTVIRPNQTGGALPWPLRVASGLAPPTSNSWVRRRRWVRVMKRKVDISRLSKPFPRSPSVDASVQTSSGEQGNVTLSPSSLPSATGEENGTSVPFVASVADRQHLQAYTLTDQLSEAAGVTPPTPVPMLPASPAMRLGSRGSINLQLDYVQRAQSLAGPVTSEDRGESLDISGVYPVPMSPSRLAKGKHPAFLADLESQNPQLSSLSTSNPPPLRRVLTTPASVVSQDRRAQHMLSPAEMGPRRPSSQRLSMRSLPLSTDDLEDRLRILQSSIAILSQGIQSDTEPARRTAAVQLWSEYTGHARVIERRLVQSKQELTNNIQGALNDSLVNLTQVTPAQPPGFPRRHRSVVGHSIRGPVRGKENVDIGAQSPPLSLSKRWVTRMLSTPAVAMVGPGQASPTQGQSTALSPPALPTRPSDGHRVQTLRHLINTPTVPNPVQHTAPSVPISTLSTKGESPLFNSTAPTPIPTLAARRRLYSLGAVTFSATKATSVGSNPLKASQVCRAPQQCTDAPGLASHQTVYSLPNVATSASSSAAATASHSANPPALQPTQGMDSHAGLGEFVAANPPVMSSPSDLQGPWVGRYCLPDSAWEPDEITSACRLCSRRFTLFFRRHHCRRCGLVVCDPCSSNRDWLVEPEYWQPVSYLSNNPAESGTHPSDSLGSPRFTPLRDPSPRPPVQSSPIDTQFRLSSSLTRGIDSSLRHPPSSLPSQLAREGVSHYPENHNDSQVTPLTRAAEVPSPAAASLDSPGYTTRPSRSNSAPQVGMGSITCPSPLAFPPHAYGIFRTCNRCHDQLRQPFPFAIPTEAGERVTTQLVPQSVLESRHHSPPQTARVSGLLSLLSGLSNPLVPPRDNHLDNGNVISTLYQGQNRSESSLMQECPVCNVRLDTMSPRKEVQEEHVRQCLESSAHSVQPVRRYIAYRLEARTSSPSSPLEQPAGDGDSMIDTALANAEANSPTTTASSLRPDTLIGQECLICFEEFESGQIVARLNCLCTYHRSCIDAWLRRSQNCPVHYT